MIETEDLVAIKQLIQQHIDQLKRDEKLFGKESKIVSRELQARWELILHKLDNTRFT